MNKAPQLFWDEESRQSLCVLINGEKTYIGTATCHPNDIDMMNEKTGSNIALFRAQIQALRDRRDTLRIELKILKHLYATMKDSKRFNPEGYEAKMLLRQIQRHEMDIDTTIAMILETQSGLKKYISDKDEFYKKIRRLRKEQELEKIHNNDI